MILFEMFKHYIREYKKNKLLAEIAAEEENILYDINHGSWGSDEKNPSQAWAELQYKKMAANMGMTVDEHKKMMRNK